MKLPACYATVSFLRVDAKGTRIFYTPLPPLARPPFAAHSFVLLLDAFSRLVRAFPALRYSKKPAKKKWSREDKVFVVRPSPSVFIFFPFRQYRAGFSVAVPLPLLRRNIYMHICIGTFWVIIFSIISVFYACEWCACVHMLYVYVRA